MWIAELPQCRARRLIRPGVSMSRRFWPESDAPHHHLDAFPQPGHVVSVTIESNGLAIIGTRHYTEHGMPSREVVAWRPRDVIAIITADGPGDRLILPGGYLQAHAGTDHQVWTAFHSTPDRDDLLADGVSVAEGRAMLARHA